MLLMAGAALGQVAAPPLAGYGVAPPYTGAAAALPPGAPSGGSVLVPGIAEISVSPRAWYLFESFGSGKQNALGSDEFMLGGATFGARFNALPATTFNLAALYGTNAPERLVSQSSNFTILSSDGATTFTNTSNTTTVNTRRLDLEFLGITAITDTWAWVAGARFENHASTNTGTTVESKLSTSNGLTITPTPTRSTDRISDYTVKGGLAISAPMTDRITLFGNALALLGFATPSGPSSDFGIVGPDVSVGLKYDFSSTISADFRYRTMVYFLFGTPHGTGTNYVIYQGPMVGLNFKFN
jgi:hypothetical protein